MANTQSRIDLLEEQISKLIVENNELKKEKIEFLVENIEIKADNVKLKQALEKYVILLAENSENNCAYFHDKTLERYPDLYYDCSGEKHDYYGITDNILCPLCNLDHYTEEAIEERYKDGSYYIKCFKHGIKIKITA